ncbi:MAG: SGNH/GDSL hydrolase family protein [Planctomycetota bacterium]|nr:SGNH/GDSL hydrolase family protein [Planctomycetota bacterium]
MSKQRFFLAKLTALVAGPVCLLLDTTVAASRGWETPSRLELFVVSLAALSVAAVLAMTVIPAGRRWLERRAGQMCLLALSLPAALGIGEAFLSCFFQATLSPPFHTRRPGMHLVFRPIPGAMPGVLGESRYTINSLGIRGPELPPRHAAYRILCVGGSTTECSYLDDEETWPQLLRERLNASAAALQVWVGNLGISGFASQHHLRFVVASNLVEEVDCVLLLVGVNDLTRYLRRCAGESEYVAPADGTAPLWTRSMMLSLVRFVRERVQGGLAEDAAGQGCVLRRRERQRATVVERMPDLTPGLAEYRQRLAGMIHAVRRKGAVPVFLTQPTLWDRDLSPQALDRLWFGWFGRMGSEQRYLSVARLQEGMQRYNEVLRVTCEELDVSCIDLRSMNGQAAFFYDDCHFNEAGAREVAALVARTLPSCLGRNPPGPSLARQNGSAGPGSRGPR